MVKMPPPLNASSNRLGANSQSTVMEFTLAPTPKLKVKSTGLPVDELQRMLAASTLPAYSFATDLPEWKRNNSLSSATSIGSMG